MRKNEELLTEIEKGFSKYVKSALLCTAKNYYARYFNDAKLVEPFEEMIDLEDENINIAIMQSNIFYLERYLEDELLSRAVNTLNVNEKKLLFMKFYEDRTDEQIARVFGVTRQALTKSKKKILDKLRIRMKS